MDSQIQIEIRKAKLEDIFHIKPLMEATFGPFKKIHEFFEKWIADDNFSVQVAVVKDEIIGVCTWGAKSGNELPKYETFGQHAVEFIKDKKVALVLNLAVKPQYRKQGLGKKLSFAHLEWLVKQNCSIVLGSSWVHGTEDNSQHLFLKGGFKKIGESRDYYRVQMQHGGICSVCKSSDCNCNSILFGVETSTLINKMNSLTKTTPFPVNIKSGFELI